MNALRGKIVSAPLAIEDKTTHERIKESTVYIHSVAEVESLYITALVPEGTFQLRLESQKQMLQHRKAKDNYTDEQWLKLVEQLFSGTYDNNDLELSGKFLTSSSNYENGELLEEEDEGDEEGNSGLQHKYISIDIKTANKKLTITLGTFQVPIMDDMNGGEEETNLLNWLDLLISGNSKNIKLIQDLQRKNMKLCKEVEYYKNEVTKSASEHVEIMNDIENKFYTVLNAKKDRIWELEQKMKGKDQEVALDGLNEKYIDNNKFNLNVDIDVDSIPNKLRSELIKKKKNIRKDDKKASSGRKRKKVEGATVKMKKESEDDNDDDDDKDDDEEMDEAYEEEKQEDENNEEEDEGEEDEDENDEEVDVARQNIAQPEVKVEQEQADTDEEEVQENPPQIPLPHSESKSDSSEVKDEESLSINELERIQKEKQKNKFKLRRFTTKSERKAMENKANARKEDEGEQIDQEEEEEEEEEAEEAADYATTSKSARTLSDRDIVQDSISLSPPIQDDTDIDSEDDNSNDTRSDNVDISDSDDAAHHRTTSTQSAISDSLKS